MNFYKIRDTVTYEFSSGGLRPHWSKKGKVWKSKADLKKHLKLVEDTFNRYENCEIIEYEVVEQNMIQIEDFE